MAACGGKPPATGPTSNTGHATPVAGSAVALWDKVLVKGKTVTLHASRVTDEASTHPVITVTVTDVATANGTTTAQVAWKLDSGADAPQLPTTIAVSATEVRLGDMTFPVALADKTLPSGLYVALRNGSVCYGSGPPPGTTDECADVCDASVCIDDGGFSGGLGTFWPDYFDYERR
jgi:hypothetical protein